jgi:acetyltransferase-like isoleucine patch superfamily enzyme
MIRDHRPYWLKRLFLDFQAFYVRRFLKPQFHSLGRDFTFMKPWYVELFGSPIKLGNCANVIASADQRVRLSVWSPERGKGSIEIGDYCLICPGVRMGSGDSIAIGSNCMIASGVYITDSDWHDIYNRVAAGKTASVHIEENVWIGDRATVCKGVTIGENSIVGTGAVVVNSIPADTIAAGNPAVPVKRLDRSARITKRGQWFSDPVRLARNIDQLDREMLQDNTLVHWLRYKVAPKKGE